MSFRVLDLFSGAGGLSKGISMAKGFQPVLATDFKPMTLKTYQYNMSQAKTICGDITKENVINKIIHEAKQLRVNMIVGGPPCQGFSHEGKQLGLKDPRNFLFLRYLKVVQALQPKIFIIENVKAMLDAEHGYFKHQIIKKIHQMHYHLTLHVLTATHYGVPETRQRTIILASKDKQLHLPKPTVNKPTTVYDAISDLAYLKSGQGKFKQNYKMRPKTKYQKLMRKGSKYLYNHRATRHSKKTLYKLSLIPAEKGKTYLPKKLWGHQQFKSTWGRLKWNMPSPTIDTRFDTPSDGTNTHPTLNRAITPREAARIQSFPDTFVFLGNKTQVRTQIGNAVPPLMARAIANCIRKQVID